MQYSTTKGTRWGEEGGERGRKREEEGGGRRGEGEEEEGGRGKGRKGRREEEEGGKGEEGKTVGKQNTISIGTKTLQPYSDPSRETFAILLSW